MMLLIINVLYKMNQIPEIVFQTDSQLNNSGGEGALVLH